MKRSIEKEFLKWVGPKLDADDYKMATQFIRRRIQSFKKQKRIPLCAVCIREHVPKKLLPRACNICKYGV